MLNFRENKVKLALIEDYVTILSIHAFYDNNFDCISNVECSSLFTQTKKLNNYIKTFYESLLKKLKFDELSLLILKKDIKSNNYLFKLEQKNNFKTINSTLHKFELKINTIATNLNDKLKKLKLCSTFIKP